MNLDVEYWIKFKKFFELYEKGVTNSDSENYIPSLPSGFKFLTVWYEDEKKWYLNPAGETFYLSLLSEEDVYLQVINDKMVFKKSSETTLWDKARNKNVQTLKDIPDDEVKNLLRRVLKFGFVKKIELVDYHKVGTSQGETRLEYKRKNEESKSHYVQYDIKGKDGVQAINVFVDNGFCDEMIFMLGKKVFV